MFAASFNEALLRLSQYAFSMISPESESTKASLSHRALSYGLR